jgi:3-hydroxyisobutyrate dehydrogenase-like beta-hydroxyacid dehydrogenase
MKLPRGSTLFYAIHLTRLNRSFLIHGYFWISEHFMRVAFLGLGIMGHSMATNLVKAGHEVAVWNRSAGKQVDGARMAASPAEAANSVEVIWLCVSDTAAVESVIFGADGVEQALTEGMVIADSSTISPSATRKFAERVARKGVQWVDSPMTGSKAGAEAGTLLFMIGGDGQAIEKLKPLYAAMGKKICHMGETGKGQSAKLVMNLQIALIYEGFAEALTLGAKLGVDAGSLVNLINSSMVKSGVVEYKAPFVLNRDFTPNFPLRLMRKDIRLALEAAKESRVKLPGLETVEEIYDVSVEEGNADFDYAATLLLLEKWAGVEVRGQAA